MKKRLLSIVLCVVLCVSLLPAAALADAPEEYALWVNGEQFTSEKLTITCGSGTAVYNLVSATLTLNNAAITQMSTCDIDLAGIGYSGSEPLNIVLVGTNTIDLPEMPDEYVDGIYSTAASISITGDVLKVNVAGGKWTSGIYCSGNISNSAALEITAGPATATEDGISYGIRASYRAGAASGTSGAMTNYGTITASAGTAAVCSCGVSCNRSLTNYGTITGTGSAATGYEAMSCGVHCYYGLFNYGDITAAAGAAEKSAGVYVEDSGFINDGTITATGGSASASYGVCMESTGALTNETTGKITATGGAAEGYEAVSCGVFVQNILHSEGSITATGGTAAGQEARSYGISAQDSLYSAGIITATGGTATGAAAESYGIFAQDHLLSAGSITAAAASNSSMTFGIKCKSLENRGALDAAAGNACKYSAIGVGTLGGDITNSGTLHASAGIAEEGTASGIVTEDGNVVNSGVMTAVAGQDSQSFGVYVGGDSTTFTNEAGAYFEASGGLAAVFALKPETAYNKFSNADGPFYGSEDGTTWTECTESAFPEPELEIELYKTLISGSAVAKYVRTQENSVEFLGVVVDGTPVTSANKDDIFGESPAPAVSTFVQSDGAPVLNLKKSVSSITSTLPDLTVCFSVTQTNDLYILTSGDLTLLADEGVTPIAAGTSCMIGADGDLTVKADGSFTGTGTFLYVRGAEIDISGGGCLLGGNTNITADGDVTLESTDGAVCSSELNVSGADVTVTGSSVNALIGGDATITATGDVTLANAGGPVYSGNHPLIINAGGAVEILGKSASASRLFSYSVAISAGGNVDIRDDGNGYMMHGMGFSLAVNKAKYVTVTGNTSDHPMISSTFVTLNSTDGFTLVNNGSGWVMGWHLAYTPLAEPDSERKAMGYTAADATEGGVEIANGTTIEDVENYTAFKKIELKAAPINVTADPDSLTGGGTVTLTTSRAAGSVSCSDGSIAVTGSGTNWTAALPNADATYTFTAKAGTAQGTCDVTVSYQAPAPAPVPVDPPVLEKELPGYAACKHDETCVLNGFTDTDPGAWYHDGIHYCVENGLMQGVPGMKFDPDGITTRGQIVEILYRLEGEPALMNTNIFDDVASGSWYERAVVWAQGNGIVNGYGNGKFGPEDPVSREQLALILYRYAQYKGQGFTGEWMFLLDYTDRGDISEWADEAVHWCSMNNIVTGKDGKIFDPQGDAKRAEAACMIQRFCEALEK